METISKLFSDNNKIEASSVVNFWIDIFMWMMKYIKSYLKNSLQKKILLTVPFSNQPHTSQDLYRCAKIHSSKYLIQFISMLVECWKYKHFLAPHQICNQFLAKTAHQEGEGSIYHSW